MAQGYLVFHLNLAFSSVPAAARPDVIRKCYWPLLQLAAETGIPMGIEPTGWKYRLCTLIPAPAFLAPLLWGTLEFWLAVPTSVFCFILLPIAYISFWVLMNSRAYLGDDRPEGGRRIFWNVGLGLVVLIVVIALLVPVMKMSSAMG